jgi:two-component system response regulator VicR
MKTILIIDDDKDIVIVTKFLIQQWNYHVLTAYTAEEALELLETETPDLILLDLFLPEMQGTEFCKTIREIPRLSQIPVIVFTASSSSISKNYLAMGANDYILKPFDEEALKDKINHFLPQI